MTVAELLEFTAFHGATVTNADTPELDVSFDDEIIDIVSVQSETKFIQVGGFAFPKTFLNVLCTIRRTENG